MSNTETFKVIIIGGGPTGLALAHMLHLAGIDYKLYDKRKDLCERHGAGLAIQPQNCRILEQLGILDEVIQQELAPEMQVHREVNADGNIQAEYPFFHWLKENHGYTMLLFERWQYLQLLYDTLPDRESHIVINKTFQSLCMIGDAKVGVRFTDGSEDEGSMVIGADGVYSRVRDCVIHQAPKSVFEHKPYRISFRALYGVGTLPAGLDSGVVREIPHQGWWFQIISQPQRVFWMLYQALDRPTTHATFYREEEAEALAAQHGDCPVGEGLTLRDLRTSKTFEKLAVLEEGIAPKWYWKRVVLIGDAVHKVTPNQAHGANIGLESAACLVNQLRSLIKLSPNPTETQLEQVFHAYQAFHIGTLSGDGAGQSAPES
ncbi:hypothetical protein J7T55_014149 [Diaporthe amygdali]|uniref:uncharacterized protein n=1 Tax=Phomopsis amygdali TaxID=1214568 RepID=UPI0022FF07A7|nr:uncharacterized protein J7T55_014149 [Diaporthe amygdali]KAJ0109587.1 hypothetical protein J7T55_014149 [Diaporthe amygdali]